MPSGSFSREFLKKNSHFWKPKFVTPYGGRDFNTGFIKIETWISLRVVLDFGFLFHEFRSEALADGTAERVNPRRKEKRANSMLLVSIEKFYEHLDTKNVKFFLLTMIQSLDNLKFLIRSKFKNYFFVPIS